MFLVSDSYVQSTEFVEPRADFLISLFGGQGVIPQRKILSIKNASLVLNIAPTLCALLTSDFVILLEGDPEVIYLRKKEISSDAISNYIDLYKRYIKSNSIKSYTIDTTKYNIKETYDLATIKIETLLNER